ncbi:hypothetical protein GCM10009779_39920 [Polymorphospora rubra]|uniref:Uncharacterized protein n=1 Tax=Polymorphospora rubra TaxID=338584 RepID=A0A810MXI3_9ACTN|nr:hypothetical protein Prubr_29070 [Polymorphospora rubra]
MVEVVPNIIAGLAIAVSAFTWWIDRRRARETAGRQAELTEAQDVLREQQISLDRQMLEFVKEIRSRADIRVTFSRTRFGAEEHRLSIRNSGQGPAFDIQAHLRGQIDMDGGFQGKTDLVQVDEKFPPVPIDRLDPESQEFVVRYEAPWGSWAGPVSITLTWRESDGPERHEKVLQLTP